MNSVLQRLSDTFMATGNENYLLLGNFLPDSLSDTTHLNQGGNNGVYIIIDDVKLIRCFALGTDHYEMKNISIYPNPATEYLVVDLEKENTKSQNISLKIMNLYGQTMYTKEDCKKVTRIDISDLPKGVYFVQVKSGALLSNRKIVVE